MDIDLAADPHVARTVRHRPDGCLGGRAHRPGHPGIHRTHRPVQHGAHDHRHRHGQRSCGRREPEPRRGTRSAGAALRRAGPVRRTGRGHPAGLPRRDLPGGTAGAHADARTSAAIRRPLPRDLPLVPAGAVSAHHQYVRPPFRPHRAAAARRHAPCRSSQHLGRSRVRSGLVGLPPLRRGRSGLGVLRLDPPRGRHPAGHHPARGLFAAGRPSSAPLGAARGRLPAARGPARAGDLGPLADRVRPRAHHHHDPAPRRRGRAGGPHGRNAHRGRHLPPSCGLPSWWDRASAEGTGPRRSAWPMPCCSLPSWAWAC